MSKLAEVLLERGMASSEQLDEAERRRNGGSLGRALVSADVVDERELVRILAETLGMPFIELSETDIDARAVTLVSDGIAKRYHALPIGFDEGRLVVAMCDPGNVFAIDDIRTITGLDVSPVVATRDDIATTLARYHSMADEIEAIGEELGADIAHVGESADSLEEINAVDEAPIVKFVNLLITQAVNEGASDIHIEPTERSLRVRFRVDGVLHEVMQSPKNIQNGVTSRLKIMAEVDIAERRIPQDGRIGLIVAGKAIDLRFSTLPTVFGEKIVMRILDKSAVLLELEDLGFRPDNERRYQESYRKPYGMILVTGPTGSGKSTTLYATLNVLSQPEVNIVTVEDPVEYRLPGINQVQTNAKAGLSFASALRSILRQDPDIVLVGEMRDRETAQIGVEAALTGHLVLSTLHTNDAPSAITRLTEMGIEPFLVGSATDCVLAQRLARRVCKRCVEMVDVEPDVLKDVGFPDDVVEERPKLPTPVGCRVCSNSGYKGRLAVHEVMQVSEEINRMCVARASSEEIRRVAIEQGMQTMRQDGLAKVLQGLTTVEEIGRVIV